MKDIGENRYDASTTMTLIRGEHNIVVDTGNLGQEQELLHALVRFDLRPEDIKYVVLTHTCPDHHQNNFLFSHATFVDGTSIYGFGSEYYVWQGMDYEIEKGVTVTRLPGHTPYDVAVFVETDQGIVAVAGDLFFWKDDFEYSSHFAWDVEKLKKSREEVIKRADLIVPGHGPIFSAK
jgi:glyoxylase-like metal-dependent hydrolase (beta-lactamase superfamily II)